MSVILFANVGNSDVWIDGRRPTTPRVDGRAAWEHYIDHTFDLPIIVPSITWVLERHPQIDRVILFYTDQPATEQTLVKDRAGVALRDKDTVWFSKIIVRYLREKFEEQIGDIIPQAIENQQGEAINPSIPDEAFEALDGLLQRLYRPDIECCYVLMSGGLPAANSSLQLCAVASYGAKCVLLYKPEGTSRVRDQRLGEQLQAIFRRSAAIEALNRQSYATALNLVGKDVPEAIRALLQFAVYRETFDFKRASQSLQQASKYARGELRTLIDEAEAQLAHLANHDRPALLRELVLNANIAFANGRYADFLGRIFRFQEATTRYVVETYLGIRTDIGVDRSAFQTDVQQNDALVEWLGKRTLHNQPLRYDVPTVPVLMAMLYYLIKGGTRGDGTPGLTSKQRGAFQGLKRALDKIDSFSQLRNRSIIAHGFEGISQEALGEISGNADAALTAAQTVLETLQIPEDDSLRKISEHIRHHLLRGGRT